MTAALPMFRIRQKLISALIIAVSGWLLLSGVTVYVKAHVAQLLLTHAWQTAISRAEFRMIKPWPGADTFPIAKISAARLNWSAVVLEGATGESLAFGPGHIRNSPAPGFPGNSVIAGHRDTHFHILKQLMYDESLKIERTDGKIVEYRVRNMRIVHETDMSVVENTDRSRLTLITCYPFNAPSAGGSLRYIVSAEIFRAADSTPQQPKPLTMSLINPPTSSI